MLKNISIFRTRDSEPSAPTKRYYYPPALCEEISPRGIPCDRINGHGKAHRAGTVEHPIAVWGGSLEYEWSCDCIPNRH